METLNVIITAAGAGQRFGSKKQFEILDKEPVLKKTVDCFAINPLENIIVVVPHEDVEFTKNLLRNINRSFLVVEGGDTRQESVYNGLMAVSRKDSIVMIHDGARPFASCSLINRVLDGLEGFDGCIPGLNVANTIKEANDSKVVTKTIPRENLYEIQTPQAFMTKTLIKAHEKARKENIKATDDSYLVESIGGKVKLVEGDELNIKITLSKDMLLAEAINAIQNRNRI